MERLRDGAEECEVRVLAFCLMTNHVHLVVETPLANLGQFMHKLETGYAVYYNKRHRESGHLMQGRYGAKAVEGDDYLLALARYVHLNPVYVGAWHERGLKERVRALRAYRWSSYRTYLGKKEWDFVTDRPLLAMMDGRSDKRRRIEFRHYVEAALAETDEEFRSVYKGSRLGIGGEEFLVKLADLYETVTRKRKKSEDIVLRRVGCRLPADRIVEVACRHLSVERGAERQRRRESWVRPVVARMLSRYGGLTQREIAARLGVRTGKSVSEQLQRLAAALAEDRSLAQLVTQLEADLKVVRNKLNH